MFLCIDPKATLLLCDQGQAFGSHLSSARTLRFHIILAFDERPGCAYHSKLMVQVLGSYSHDARNAGLGSFGSGSYRSFIPPVLFLVLAFNSTGFIHVEPNQF